MFGIRCESFQNEVKISDWSRPVDELVVLLLIQQNTGLNALFHLSLGVSRASTSLPPLCANGVSRVNQM